MALLLFLTISVAFGGALTAGLLRLARGRIDELTRILGANLVGYLVVCLAWVAVDRWFPAAMPSSLENMAAVSLFCQMVWGMIALVRSAHAPPERPPAPSAGRAVIYTRTRPETETTRHPGTTTGFVRRHWRGDNSLGVSVWAVTVVGLLHLHAVRSLFTRQFELEPELSEATFQAIDYGIMGFTILFAGWALIGTWRSAARRARERRAAGRRAVWARVAQVWVALALIRLTTTAFTTLVLLGVTWQSRHGDDPKVPPYSIRVMRGGTEAEISGGFRHGIARDLVAVLRSTPSIRVVHLTSEGGHIYDGELVSRVVRRGELATFVPTACNSACTLAFAGGTKRWITKESTLGFHAPSVIDAEPSIVSIELIRTIEAMRGIYRAAGFDQAFVERALATPATELLEPSTDDLLKYHVATGIAEPDQFAASGLDLSDRKRAASFLTRLLPAFAAVEERHPDTFAEMADAFQTAYASGASHDEAIKKPLSMMLDVLRKSLTTADDETQIEYLKLLADAAVEARTRKVGECVEIFDTFPGPYALQIESEDLSRRRDQLAARAIRTASDDNRRDEESVKANARRFMGLVAERMGADDIAIMIADQRSESTDDRYCSAWIATMRLAETLPPALPAAFARRLRH